MLRITRKLFSREKVRLDVGAEQAAEEPNIHEKCNSQRKGRAGMQ